jgi:hypothetical protein
LERKHDATERSFSSIIAQKSSYRLLHFTSDFDGCHAAATVTVTASVADEFILAAREGEKRTGNDSK